MAKTTPGMVKNGMKRCLNAILDRSPSDAEVRQLWLFFKSSCAYCGLKLSRDKREGHCDHLISHSEGGTNDIYNHVLACARCNGDLKREENWESFLHKTALSEPELQLRRARIEEWMQKTSDSRVSIGPEERMELDLIIEKARKDFDDAVAAVRSIKLKKTAASDVINLKDELESVS